MVDEEEGRKKDNKKWKQGGKKRRGEEGGRGRWAGGLKEKLLREKGELWLTVKVHPYANTHTRRHAGRQAGSAVKQPSSRSPGGGEEVRNITLHLDCHVQHDPPAPLFMKLVIRHLASITADSVSPPPTPPTLQHTHTPKTNVVARDVP